MDDAFPLFFKGNRKRRLVKNYSLSAIILKTPGGSMLPISFDRKD